jgi:glycosyltransferase involved in cell wall biosynthesis
LLTILNVAYPFAAVGPDAVGGAEQILAALDDAIVSAGMRSLVLACEGSQVAGRLFPMPRIGGPITDALRKETFAVWREEVTRIAGRERVDLVHFHGIGFGHMLPRDDTEVLATLHLPPEWYEPEIFAPRRPRTWLNCVSRSQRRECPPSAVLIEDIPNGVDLARFHPRPDKDDFALVLGRVCPEKGVHLAIEAARWAGVPLVIAGEVFPYPEHVRYFREKIEPCLGPRCTFVGKVGMPRKGELLARARCVIVTSLVPETSSLVTMEALASGTPVIARPKGALPELIEHGRTGILADDVPAMRDGLHRVKMLDSRECRRVAEQRFDKAAMCDRYLAAYARLAVSRRRRGPFVAGGELR